MNTPKIALVYDRVNKFGGAERVLEALHQAFPDAPLYTSVYDPQGAPWANGWDVRTTFLQNIPFFRTHHEAIAWLMPLAFESLNFDEFDVVISVTSEAAKGIMTKPHTKHIAYLLTPTRYLWNTYEEYYAQFRDGAFTFVLAPLYRLIMRYLRMWDVIAAHRPDEIIPISNVVDQRAIKYYHSVTLPVIYPPVETARFAKNVAQSPMSKSYYLVVSRLVAYKRIDLAIQACIKLHRHLVIVGTGSEDESLHSLANGSPYIHFVGQIADDELAGYYQHCTALLFPGEEDFGISAVEALAAGRPSVVYEKSGNAEVIEEGKTGAVMHAQSINELVSAISRVEAVQYKPALLQQVAQRYNVDQFIRQWRKHVQST